MTKQEKQLLLIDLCARLPYGVKATTIWNGAYTITGYANNRFYLDCPIYDEGDDEWLVESVKPYLRPMSSMTEAEMEELKELTGTDNVKQKGFSYSGLIGECFGMMYDDCSTIVDWLNSHHFDYRGLIEKGLALEAPEGIYNTKTE